MKLQDQERKRNERLNDLEDEERVRSEVLRQKALDQLAEQQEDEIKKLNEVWNACPNIHNNNNTYLFHVT